MHYIHCRIEGKPAVRRSNRSGPEPEWIETIVRATSGLPKADGPCLLRVTFFLPNDKYSGSPYGADLDNLLKPFLDGLGKTVFAGLEGGDGCVLSMEVSKLRATLEDGPGVRFEIIPFHALPDSSRYKG